MIRERKTQAQNIEKLSEFKNFEKSKARQNEKLIKVTKTGKVKLKGKKI
jgi:hypothetical protein